ncbi:hypothetical protein QU864_27220, partial [Escherichia coli]|nr:hypothetical protein [Escherichia coli]
MSIDSKIDSYKPPPGCVDQKLCSNNFSGPNIVVMNDELNTSEPQLMSPGSEMSTANNESKLYTPKTYDELLSLFKYQLVRFNEYIKTQEYKNNISTRINYEQV